MKYKSDAKRVRVTYCFFCKKSLESKEATESHKTGKTKPKV